MSKGLEEDRFLPKNGTSPLSHTTLDQTCTTLSAERDAPIVALIIQLKFELMLFIRVPCSFTLMNFAKTSTRPEKNYPLSGIGGADPKRSHLSKGRSHYHSQSPKLAHGGITPTRQPKSITEACRAFNKLTPWSLLF